MAAPEFAGRGAMKRSISLCAMLVLALPMLADPAGKFLDASMVATGTITVNPDGTVRGYTLDKQDKLPPPVVGLISQTLSRWTFRPVMADGKPVPAEADMSLRIVAHQKDDDHATARIVGAKFGCDAGREPRSAECSANEWVTPLRRAKPGYPANLAMAEVGGIVYVVLEVGKDGHVTNSAVRQANLRARMGPHDSDVARTEFSEVSLAAARKWTFRAPTRGREAAKDHWVLVVPVVFSARRADDVQYGEWMACMPGPIRVIPWAQDHGKASLSGSDDAIPDGAVFQKDPRFVLLTPFGGNDPQPQAGALSGQG